MLIDFFLFHINELKSPLCLPRQKAKPLPSNIISERQGWRVKIKLETFAERSIVLASYWQLAHLFFFINGKKTFFCILFKDNW